MDYDVSLNKAEYESSEWQFSKFFLNYPINCLFTAVLVVNIILKH